MLYTLGPRLSSRRNALDRFSVRISEDARRIVVFFGSPSPPDGSIEYGGTGFLVSYEEDGYWFGYLVTARHVAERVSPENGIVLRVNRHGGGAASIEIDRDLDWSFHPDESVDVAATPIFLNYNEFDVTSYTLKDFVRADAHKYRVRCGDPISIVGLFRLHPGSDRNVPIVHSGNIALLPDPNEKITIQDRGTSETRKVEGYLVESQTFEGLSGAPVFQAEMVKLQNYPNLNGSGPMVLSGVQLLGIYQGAWDGEASNLIVSDRQWKGNRRIPVGMGIVVPAERLWELIVNDDKLKESRSEILKMRAERNATAVTDSALPVPPSTDENPTHREDFTRLLGAAVRKPPQED